MDLELDGESLTFASIARFVRDPSIRVRISPMSASIVRSARIGIENAISSGIVLPGITTGMGPLSEKRITNEQMRDLQRNVVHGLAAGLGAMLPPPETRLLMLLRANAFAKGCSGIRLETLEALVALINSRIVPVIPAKGTAGAGSRAPLAYVAGVLMGEGLVLTDGREVPAAKALEGAGLKPVQLRAREGLAFCVGSELTTAVGTRVAIDARTLVRELDVIAALTLDALGASDGPLDERVQGLRPHPGQKATARNVRRLLAQSQIRAARNEKGVRTRRGAGANSVRCVSQVHGAARDAIDFVERVLTIELNAATDETFVLPCREPPGIEVISAGNFHGAPSAMALDVLGVAVAHLGTIAERRTARLVSAPDSGFPPYLTPREQGLHVGLMEVQVQSAALVAENRVFANPCSLDSIPSSDVEDHTSMGAAAARKARQILSNVELVAAIELLAAAQALEFHEPKRTSPALEAVRQALRDFVPPLAEDRSLSRDLHHAAALLRDGTMIRRVEEILGAPLD